MTKTFDRDTILGMSRQQLAALAEQEGFKVAKNATKPVLLDVLAPQDVEAAGNGATAESSPADVPAEATPGHSAASTTTERVLTVYQALLEVMRKVGPIAKNQRNMESHYAARSIDDVMDALHDLMAEAGVLPIPTVLSTDYTDRGKQIHARLQVRWTFYGAGGDSVEAVLPCEGLDSSDKATNKALQASLKYLLLDSFVIPLNGPDADAYSPEAGEAPSAPSLDDQARERGWEDAASEKVAHDALAARIQKLPEGEVLLARQMRQDLGWPMKRQDFVGFARWVTEAEKATGGTPEPSADPEQLAAARAALADAEATVTGKATLRHGAEGQTVHSPLLNGDTVVCSTCGNSGPTVTEIQHEDGCPEGSVI